MSETYLEFPFAISPDGSVAVADEERHIRQRLEQILFTSPGERLMVPEFGCGVADLVFSGNSAVLAAAAEFKIARALQTYMGNRVMINGVNVVNEEEKLRITIEYTKTRDLQRAEAVFEFMPSEAGGV